MNKIKNLLIAIVGNALGVTLMVKSNLGLSVWASSALSISSYYNITLGTAFTILSVISYVIATIIYRKFNLAKCAGSFMFAFSFAFFTDWFIALIPKITHLNIFLRIGVNIIGLAVLMYAIALHLKIDIAVHPMDVYLASVQYKLNSIAKGTYLAYFSAFVLTLAYGYLNGKIVGIGLGTINTLLFGGVLLEFYSSRILEKKQ